MKSYVILRTESQKDGEYYHVMTRKAAEDMISRNYEWRHQFKIVFDVTDSIKEILPQEGEQDELWDDVVAQLVTFTSADKMQATRLCEDLKKQFLLSKK